MRSSKPSLVAAVLLFGCGSSTPAARFEPPRPTVATKKQPIAMRCPGDAAFDPARGCVQKSPFSHTVRVEYEHAMGKGFVLVGAAFALDGELVFDSNDPKWVGRQRFVVSETDLGPGSHELGVFLNLRGEGHGVFSYLRGYRFQVRSSERFDLDAPMVIKVIGHERGGPTTDLEERPAVRYEKGRP